MVHSVLHLIGYYDLEETEEDQRQMRAIRK